MTPIHQTITGKDGGNCLTACLASILDLPIDQVPNFVVEHGDGWETAVEAWLADRGLRFLRLYFAHHRTFELTYFAEPGRHCLVIGPSTLGSNRDHAVVCRVAETGGLQLVHDPAPGGTGLLAGGHRWVQFLVPIGGPA